MSTGRTKPFEAKVGGQLHAFSEPEDFKINGCPIRRWKVLRVVEEAGGETTLQFRRFCDAPRNADVDGIVREFQSDISEDEDWF